MDRTQKILLSKILIFENYYHEFLRILITKLSFCLAYRYKKVGKYPDNNDVRACLY
jgi:hypothetical protein